MSTLPISVYLVGVDEDDACATFSFDSYESAESYQLDNPGSKIYQVEAIVDFSTILQVKGA